MFLGKDVIGNPIINMQSGRKIGQVQDLYLDKALNKLAGLYVGSDGLLNPTPRWISAFDVAVVSQDTVLVNGNCIVTHDLDDVAHPWLRRDDLQGRAVDTLGGTKIGRIGDVILDDEGAIVGFSLDRVYVKGPVAERRALRRTAVHDVGHEDGSMTMNLQEVEQQDLRVVDKAFFNEEVMLETEEEDDPRKSPYADTPAASAYASHDDKSPYVPGEMATKEDEPFRSPYTTPQPATKDVAAEPFKSPYTTPEKG